MHNFKSNFATGCLTESAKVNVKLVSAQSFHAHPLKYIVRFKSLFIDSIRVIVRTNSNANLQSMCENL